MLKTTRKMQEIYEEIQRKIFYMIPEKWDELYLYASVIERFGSVETGELFFYYIPKGILRKNPINVYEIPSKFNLEEEDYMRLVELLYEKIKELRKEFKKIEKEKTWSNLTITIKNMKFIIEYNYEDLQNSNFDSFQRHVIWRNKYLDKGLEKVSKAEREIIRRYDISNESEHKVERFEESIYITDIKNMIDYDTESYEKRQNEEYEELKRKQVENFKLMELQNINQKKLEHEGISNNEHEKKQNVRHSKLNEIDSKDIPTPRRKLHKEDEFQEMQMPKGNRRKENNLEEIPIPRHENNKNIRQTKRKKVGKEDIQFWDFDEPKEEVPKKRKNQILMSFEDDDEF